MLDYLPNPDHVGLYQALASGDFARGRPRREGADAVGPGRAAEAAAGRQGRPRDLLRAGAADRARQGRAARLRRRDRAGAADVADVADSEASTARATSEAGASGPPGSPTRAPTCRRSSQRAGVPVDSVKETNVGFNLVPAMLSKKVDATLGAFWNVEGVQLRRAGKQTADHPHGAGRRADVRRADPRRAQGHARRARRRRARVRAGARARLRGGAEPTRSRRPTRS